MRGIWIIVFVLIASVSSYNKKDEYRGNTTIDCPYEFDSLAMMNVFTYVNEMPEYPGGNAAMLKFIAKKFKYPTREDFQGSFKVQFVVDIDGSIVAARIKDHDSNELTLVEKELLTMIYKMPKWKPGKCFSKSVPVKVILPLYL